MPLAGICAGGSPSPLAKGCPYRDPSDCEYEVEASRVVNVELMTRIVFNGHSAEAGKVASATGRNRTIWQDC